MESILCKNRKACYNFVCSGCGRIIRKNEECLIDSYCSLGCFSTHPLMFDVTKIRKQNKRQGRKKKKENAC